MSSNLGPYPGRPSKRLAEGLIVALALAVIAFSAYITFWWAPNTLEYIIEQRQPVSEECLKRPRKPLPEC